VLRAAVFFASVYSRVSLGYSATNAGLYLLIFFVGFATASQVGGRILDRRGARPPVVVGCAVAAVGFYFGTKLLDLDLASQGSGWWSPAPESASCRSAPRACRSSGPTTSRAS
jgi:MFS family permease